MEYRIPDGVWPVMLTPFKEDYSIDFGALEALIDWYINQGVSGLFATCQSSEISYMTLAERTELARFCCERAGKLPVVVSGHIAGGMKEQLYELQAMADTGADGLVLITNRLALPGEGEEQWKKNLEFLLRELPNEMPMGLYECPYPFQRAMSPALLHWCAETGRFGFLKDTCGHLPSLEAKINAIKGTGMKLFDANSATLRHSLALGGSGYCGVMANFHADLYVWMCRNYDDPRAEELSEFFAMSMLIEGGCGYPVCAKYKLGLDGVPMRLTSRRVHEDMLRLEWKMVTEKLRSMEGRYRRQLGLADV